MSLEAGLLRDRTHHALVAFDLALLKPFNWSLTQFDSAICEFQRPTGGHPTSLERCLHMQRLRQAYTHSVMSCYPGSYALAGKVWFQYPGALHEPEAGRSGSIELCIVGRDAVDQEPWNHMPDY